MRAYLDSSVLLRSLLNHPDACSEIKKVTSAVTSRLTRLECFRVFERLHMNGDLDEDQYTQVRQSFIETFKRIEVVPIQESVLERAESNFAVFVASLDSIHLSSAILYRKSTKRDLVFLTHDKQLGRAAQSEGFEALGC